MARRTVHVAELPSAENVVFKDSSFFKSRAELPTPEDVRQKAANTSDDLVRPDRPAPVLFEEQGLLVKYGSIITIAEAQCLWFFNRYMKEWVPTPELFGWRRDGAQTFIYMEHVRGDTLENRWPSLSEAERQTVCNQLERCVSSWRELRQEAQPYFIVKGHIGHQGSGDVIFSDAGDHQAGPFKDIASFHNFFARYSCRLHPEWNPREDFPELAGLTDEQPVVFTHSDLDRTNILVSPRDDEQVRVVAIIDWHQSGWYPRDWEFLKAQWTSDPEDLEWRTYWLPRILGEADHAYWLAWEFITGSV